MTEVKTGTVPSTGANYCTWKLQCTVSLMRNGLCRIVSAGQKLLLRQELNVMLSSSLIGTVLLRQLFNQSIHLFSTLLGDPTDPAAVWDKLSSQFQRKTWANRLALWRRLHSMKLKEGQSIQEHDGDLQRTTVGDKKVAVPFM